MINPNYHNCPKLILVEGIPGSGKTTLAQSIQGWLSDWGLQPALYLEGNLDHPADYESVACLDETQYSHLISQFPNYQLTLQHYARKINSNVLIGYRKLHAEGNGQIPELLIQDLAKYEIYEQPAGKFRRLILDSWRRFASQAVLSSSTYIFECCFLQNPLTMFLGRHDEPLSAAQGLVLEMARTIQPLNPLLIYLHPGPAGDTLRRVAQVRPQEWLDFVIAYHTQQGHGKAQGWQGFDGMVKFYEMRQSIELELLQRLPFPTLKVPHTAWQQDNQRVNSFLAESFSTHSNPAAMI